MDCFVYRPKITHFDLFSERQLFPGAAARAHPLRGHRGARRREAGTGGEEDRELAVASGIKMLTRSCLCVIA